METHSSPQRFLLGPQAAEAEDPVAAGKAAGAVEPSRKILREKRAPPVASTAKVGPATTNQGLLCVARFDQRDQFGLVSTTVASLLVVGGG
jgi:hypothetical protein